MTSERDLINQLAYREKKGRTEGKAEGIEIGVARGKAIGRTEGIEENKLTTAKTMLSKNYPINEISDITGLSKEAIERISRSSQDLQ